MRLSSPLTAAAQTAYAELFEVVRHAELARSVEHLTGSFNRKVVKGSTYWYYQFRETEGGRTRQLFVGPDNEAVRALVERQRSRDTSQLDALARSAITLGCAPAPPVHFRVIRRMSEVGFFRAGGLLIGTHAFLAFGNALGVGWGDASRTQDIDFAHAGEKLELALPADMHINTGDALTSLEAGFLPVPGFRPKDRTATFISKVDRQLRVDFLAPMVGGRETVFRHEELGVNLQPIKFLEYLLEDVGQAVMISAIGAVLVNVPDAARYAFHKLLVFADRGSRNPAKAQKDLRQAAALIEVLSEFRAGDLARLWRDLLVRGPGWRSRARTGLSGLVKVAPGLEALESMESALKR